MPWHGRAGNAQVASGSARLHLWGRVASQRGFSGKRVQFSIYGVEPFCIGCFASRAQNRIASKCSLEWTRIQFQRAAEAQAPGICM